MEYFRFEEILDNIVEYSKEQKKGKDKKLDTDTFKEIEKNI